MLMQKNHVFEHAEMTNEAAAPKVIIPRDPINDKHHNRIGTCVNRAKHFRRFNTRYKRGTIRFTGPIHHDLDT
ncbi:MULTISPECIES: hypothetical protein [Rhizobium]|uniref:hypothetical protein n=1 Tax=Rhizobium TaxID=379 RepID=UPI001B323C26|nr:MULTISPECIES: hypothetical protein [Rhizobium]MBX4911048.1 hypothetical protein [Rhizobium bangladeshense]MBX5177195.1 hypothetical protein [Rhizobium lentis]MBX5254008.1 hypothetical protein [Rhizobium sp. NLR4b]MBX5260165.1 hypothetical protein [Rhizobium sp. NLR16b]MBX5266255.1 hypothetical protein [Rhizobium sp. NLR16a]